MDDTWATDKFDTTSARYTWQGPFTVTVGRDCDSGLAPQLDGQDGGNRGSENVDEVVADQDGPEQSIWAFKQGAGAFCAAVPFLGLMTQAITIEAEHSSFGAGKECRAQQQTDQHADQKAGV